MTIRPDRWGGTSYRIVVYPPGITEAQRRRVRLWRGWPLWGAVLFLPALMVSARLTDPLTGLALATAGYLAAGAITFVRAGDIRTKVRAAEVFVPGSNSDISALVSSRVIRSLGTAMTDADQRARAGVISPTEFEATWWRIYDRLTPAAIVDASLR